MEIRVSEPSLASRLIECLPPGAETANDRLVAPPHNYSLIFEAPHYRFFAEARLLAESADLNLVLKIVRAALQHDLAIHAEPYLFVKAAVVGWRQQAILLLGDRTSGARALAAELVRAGAEYYSDTYAVFDAQGKVLPYSRPLGLPLRVGLVALARFQPEGRTRLRRLSSGKGLQALLGSGIFAATKAERAFPLFARITRNVPVLQARFADAEAGTEALLRIISTIDSKLV